MGIISEDVDNDEPYALIFPTDVYSKQEQEHIWVLNELRKDLEAEKIQYGSLGQQKQKRLNAYRWVLRLIDEITQDEETA